MKKIIIVFFALIIIVGLVGCGTEPASDLPKAEDNEDKAIAVNYIEFKRVNIEDLSEDFRNTIEDNKMEKGYELLKDPSNEYSYLAVFSGEKPSAGYGLEITEVVDNEGVTDVMVTETSPKEGEMVAQVLTYPMDIIKLTGITDNVNLIYIEQDNEEPTSSVTESLAVGEYVGQIDPHSIEVIIEEGPVAFQLSDEAVKQVSNFKEGDLVKVEWVKNDNDQMVANKLIKVEE